jgi:hypothetical protein
MESLGVVLATAVFLILHNVDGEEVAVNAEYVVTLLHGKDNRELASGGVNCIIGLSNGKRVGVIEHCSTVRQSLQQNERGK